MASDTQLMTPILNEAPPMPVALHPDERTSTVVNNGMRLHVREWGQKGAPVIVLLHGLRGYSGTWRGLAAALSDRWHMIAIDARGRGESGWDPEHNYYNDAYLSDLEAVVDHFDLDRFALIGHSMGGTTSYCYAAKHPDRLHALVVEDITAGSSLGGAGFERIVAEMAALPQQFENWAAARAYWRKLRPGVSDAAIEERLFESMHADADGTVFWRYDAKGISATRVSPDPARVVDLHPVIRAIQTPTLVVRGGKSDFCNLDKVQELESDNSMLAHATMDGASHYVHDDAPESFARIVEGFLTGIALCRSTPV